jgi:5-(carboxyamino)imidazole ribonucleotide synthase
MKATIGILGGGQLGKMITQEARRMALEVVVLDPTPDCPAAGAGARQIVADFKDESAIRRLAETCDVLTYEIELGNTGILKALEGEGRRICPAPETLRIIQDKFFQKEFLQKHGAPVPEFAALTEAPLAGQVQKFGYPCLIKLRQDAYDGRGNFTLKSPEDLAAALKSENLEGTAAKKYMLERFVPFVKEVSVMVARNRKGQVVSYPVVENLHEDHILLYTVAPARIAEPVAQKARQVAMKAVEALAGAGIFGVEMFVDAGGNILINEIAPRPHNSGHYTIEACAHSQFEMHLRAILDLPLVDPVLLSPAAMVNLLGYGGEDSPYRVEGAEEALAVPGVALHLYGKKGLKRRRKLGHVTVLDSTPEAALKKAEKVRGMIRIVPETAEAGRGKTK